MSDNPEAQSAKQPTPAIARLEEDQPALQQSFSLDDFLPLLIRLLTPQAALTTPPDFTPKTFLDCLQIYNDGTDDYLYMWVNGTWRKTMFDGIQRLVAGNGLALSPANGRGVVTATPVLPYNAVLATRGGSDATGSQAIPHGLGKVPIAVRITAFWGANTPQLMPSVGVYSAGGMKNVNAYSVVGGNGGSGDDTTNIVVISDRAGFSQIAAVSSLDATNLNLNWTQSGSPGLGGTIRMLVESFG
jgi:hypothetical protein